MDLARHLRALLHPLRTGDEVVPGVRWDGASTELGVRLRFQAGEQRLWVDLGPVERTMRMAARSARLAFGYRTEGGRSAFAAELGERLCRRLAEIVAANEDEVLAGIVEEARREAPIDARIRRVRAAHALEVSGPPQASYYTLNPYVGCLIGCRFCYAQANLAIMRHLAGLADLPWGSWVEAPQNLPELLAQEVERVDPRPIKFCPIVGDAYQPIEGRLKITRACLEVLVRTRRAFAPLILTRSSLILRDLDLLRSLPLAFAGVSLPTLDEAARRHFEPRAASVEERLDILRRLRAAGVRTVVVVQPVLPGPLPALADLLADLADGVTLDVLRGEGDAGRDFDDPRFSQTREDGWQNAQVQQLRELLRARGVSVWEDDLPPQYVRRSAATHVPT